MDRFYSVSMTYMLRLQGDTRAHNLLPTHAQWHLQMNIKQRFSYKIFPLYKTVFSLDTRKTVKKRVRGENIMVYRPCAGCCCYYSINKVQEKRFTTLKANAIT